MVPAYPRIEIQPDFVLERYLGWRVLARGDRFKVLAKRVGPARKALILSDGASPSDIDAVARRHRLVSPTTMLTVNDFRWSDGDAEAKVLGRALTPITTGRWFGAGTFYFDLAEDEATLFGRISSRERSKIRKSERDGMTAEFLEKPSERDLARFYELYDRMANERSLPLADRKSIQAMLADGALLFARACDSRGVALTLHLIYRTPTHAYYYHAVSDAVPDPGGHLLFWKSLMHLKGLGIRWYDFGLVASTDPQHGIFRFKKCFGGAFASSGREWQRNPRWLQRTTSAIRQLRDWRRRAAAKK